jgi:hypothetical protein
MACIESKQKHFQKVLVHQKLLWVSACRLQVAGLLQLCAGWLLGHRHAMVASWQLSAPTCVPVADICSAASSSCGWCRLPLPCVFMSSG